MNQILSTNNNNNKRNTELIDMRKIIIVFSVLIIVFALVIIGATAFGMIKQKSNEKQDPIANLNKPSITITEKDNGCGIHVEYSEGLQKVSYRWNDEEIMEMNLYGSTKFERTIKIPDGDNNIFHIEAIGSDGSVSTIENIFTEDGIEEYESRPKIEWDYNYAEGTIGVIKITATSDVGMKSLEYQIDDEEMQTINSTEENQKEITVEIQAKRGSNKIYIIATDINNKTTEKNETIIGVMAPEINLRIESPRTLKIDISHDMGFKKVVIKVNDKEIVYDETHPSYSPEEKNLHYQQDLPAGENRVNVQVFTLESPDKEYTKSGRTEIPE